MKNKSASFEKNGIWELVPLPYNKMVAVCICLYAPKYKGDGTLARCNAPLVAKGFI